MQGRSIKSKRRRKRKRKRKSKKDRKRSRKATKLPTNGTNDIVEAIHELKKEFEKGKEGEKFVLNNLLRSLQTIGTGLQTFQKTVQQVLKKGSHR